MLDKLTRVDNNLLFLLGEIPFRVPPALCLGRGLRHEEEGSNSNQDYVRVSIAGARSVGHPYK